MNQASRSPKPTEEQPPAREANTPAAKERYDSEELFGDRKEIFIVHNAEIYRLRRTRHDKLILYK